jgi:hypothetical protein
MEFLSKLWLGRLGLAKTYWIYNLLIPILLSIPIKLWSGEPSFFPFAYLCLLSIYSYVALIGLWRSSDLYKGNQVWNWIAKAVTVLGLLSQLLIVLAVFRFGNYYLIGYVAVVGFVMWAFYGEYKVEKAEPSQNQASPTTTASKIEIDENLIWADVAKEFESNRNEGLWTKCFVESGGDENKAKVKYLAVRFEEMLALTKVIETPAPIIKEVADLAQAQNNQAEPLNLTDDAQVIPTQASSNNEAVANDKTGLYGLIGIALLAGIPIFAIVVSNFSKPYTAQTQTQQSISPQPSSSSPLMSGHNWRAWDKQYSNNSLIKVTYVDENSIKKIGLFDKKFEVIFAEEAYGKPFKYPVGAKDKDGNVRNIFLEIYKAEYDCKNKTETIISNQFFTQQFGEPNQVELYNYDLPLGKIFSFDNSGGSFLGNDSVYKICYQLYPN